jgi:hypothetical protein
MSNAPSRSQKRIENCEAIGVSQLEPSKVNLALAQLGVIEIVRVGDARPNGKGLSRMLPYIP